MSSQIRRSSALRQTLVSRLSCLCLLPLLTSVAIAQQASIVKVQEDWEFVLNEPDPTLSAPQINMVMSPDNDIAHCYFAFEINHASSPDFEAGGMQTQHWHDLEIQARSRGPSLEILYNDGEVVRWTQQLSVSDGQLSFEILNGTSQTWGNFGGQGYLKQQVAIENHSLANYSPAQSIKYSGVGFAGNRVYSLTLKRVRWYTSDGLVWQYDTPVVIHTATE